MGCEQVSHIHRSATLGGAHDLNSKLYVSLGYSFLLSTTIPSHFRVVPHNSSNTESSHEACSTISPRGWLDVAEVADADAETHPTHRSAWSAVVGLAVVHQREVEAVRQPHPLGRHPRLAHTFRRWGSGDRDSVQVAPRSK